MEMEFKSRERRRRRRRESAEQNKKQRRALLSLPFFSSPCSCSPRNHHASNRAIIAPTTKRQLPLFFVIPSNLFCSTEYGVAGNERKNTFVALPLPGGSSAGVSSLLLSAHLSPALVLSRPSREGKKVRARVPSTRHKKTRF